MLAEMGEKETLSVRDKVLKYFIASQARSKELKANAGGAQGGSSSKGKGNAEGAKEKSDGEEEKAEKHEGKKPKKEHAKVCVNLYTRGVSFSSTSNICAQNTQHRSHTY